MKHQLSLVEFQAVLNSEREEELLRGLQHATKQILLDHGYSTEGGGPWLDFEDNDEAEEEEEEQEAGVSHAMEDESVPLGDVGGAGDEDGDQEDGDDEEGIDDIAEGGGDDEDEAVAADDGSTVAGHGDVDAAAEDDHELEDDGSTAMEVDPIGDGTGTTEAVAEDRHDQQQKQKREVRGLLAQYVQSSPKAVELFALWELQDWKSWRQVAEKHTTLLAAIVLCLRDTGCLLGPYICRRLLTTRKAELHAQLISGNQAVAVSTLRLLCALSSFSASAAREVLAGFTLTSKPVLHLFAPSFAAVRAHQRSSSSPVDNSNTAAAPVSASETSSRAVAVALVASLLACRDGAVVTRTLSNDRVVGAVFKSLHIDAASTVRGWLCALRKAISNPRVTSKAKRRIVGAHRLEQMRKLYARRFAEGEAVAEVAEAVDRTLRRLLLNPRTRAVSKPWAVQATRAASIVRLLLTLINSDDPLQRSLALDVVVVYRSVAGMLMGRLGQACEAKPTLTCLATYTFFARLLRVAPVPSTVPLIRGARGGSGGEEVLSELLPTGLGKRELTRAILSPNALLGRTGLILLYQMLDRVKRGLKPPVAKPVRVALLHRVPDLQALVALRSRFAGDGQASKASTEVDKHNGRDDAGGEEGEDDYEGSVADGGMRLTKDEELYSLVLMVLRRYNELLPEAIEAARYDFLRLVTCDLPSLSPTVQLELLKLLAALGPERLQWLPPDPQAWKSGQAPSPTAFTHILSLLHLTRSAEVRALTKELVVACVEHVGAPARVLLEALGDKSAQEARHVLEFALRLAANNPYPFSLLALRLCKPEGTQEQHAEQVSVTGLPPPVILALLVLVSPGIQHIDSLDDIRAEFHGFGLQLNRLLSRFSSDGPAAAYVRRMTRACSAYLMDVDPTLLDVCIQRLCPDAAGSAPSDVSVDRVIKSLKRFRKLQSKGSIDADEHLEQVALLLQQVPVTAWASHEQLVVEAVRSLHGSMAAQTCLAATLRRLERSHQSLSIFDVLDPSDPKSDELVNATASIPFHIVLHQALRCRDHGGKHAWLERSLCASLESLDAGALEEACRALVHAAAEHPDAAGWLLPVLSAASGLLLQCDNVEDNDVVRDKQTLGRHAGVLTDALRTLLAKLVVSGSVEGDSSAREGLRDTESVWCGVMAMLRVLGLRSADVTMHGASQHQSLWRQVIHVLLFGLRDSGSSVESLLTSMAEYASGSGALVRSVMCYALQSGQLDAHALTPAVQAGVCCLLIKKGTAADLLQSASAAKALFSLAQAPKSLVCGFLATSADAVEWCADLLTNLRVDADGAVEAALLLEKLVRVSDLCVRTLGSKLIQGGLVASVADPLLLVPAAAASATRMTGRMAGAMEVALMQLLERWMCDGVWREGLLGSHLINAADMLTKVATAGGSREAHGKKLYKLLTGAPDDSRGGCPLLHACVACGLSSPHEVLSTAQRDEVLVQVALRALESWAITLSSSHDDGAHAQLTASAVAALRMLCDKPEARVALSSSARRDVLVMTTAKVLRAMCGGLESCSIEQLAVARDVLCVLVPGEAEEEVYDALRGEEGAHGVPLLQCLLEADGVTAAMTTPTAERAQVVLQLVFALASRLATSEDGAALLRFLLPRYTGSLSHSDRLMLRLLHVISARGIVTLDVRHSRPGKSFNTAPDAHGSSWLMDWTQQERVFALMECMPLTRPLLPVATPWEPGAAAGSDEGVQELTPTDSARLSEAYDPSFVLPVLDGTLRDGQASVRGVVDSGLLSMAIMGLASRQQDVVACACSCLHQIFVLLEQTPKTDAAVKERPQLLLLMRVLQGTVPPTLASLPYSQALFLARASNLMSRPSNDLYVSLNTFLLKRRALDAEDVPLFYQLFYSSRPYHRRERIWMLRLLRDSLRTPEDLAIYRRRHCLSLILTLLESAAQSAHGHNHTGPRLVVDTQAQALALEVLEAAIHVPGGARHVLYELGLVAWVHGTVIADMMSASSAQWDRTLRSKPASVTTASLLDIVLGALEAMGDDQHKQHEGVDGDADTVEGQRRDNLGHQCRALLPTLLLALQRTPARAHVHQRQMLRASLQLAQHVTRLSQPPKKQSEQEPADAGAGLLSSNDLALVVQMVEHHTGSTPHTDLSSDNGHRLLLHRTLIFPGVVGIGGIDPQTAYRVMGFLLTATLEELRHAAVSCDAANVCGRVATLLCRLLPCALPSVVGDDGAALGLLEKVACVIQRLLLVQTHTSDDSEAGEGWGVTLLHWCSMGSALASHLGPYSLNNPQAHALVSRFKQRLGQVQAKKDDVSVSVGHAMAELLVCILLLPLRGANSEAATTDHVRGCQRVEKLTERVVKDMLGQPGSVPSDGTRETPLVPVPSKKRKQEESAGRVKKTQR